MPLIQCMGVQLVRGLGKLTGVKKIQVTPHQDEPVQLEARLAVVLSTGTRSTLPNVPGLEEADPWTPRDATSSSFVSDHLIIMGGGVCRIECATAYASFGSKVTVVGSGPEISPRVDSEAGKIVHSSLESKGVVIRISTHIVNVDRPAENNWKAASFW